MFMVEAGRKVTEDDMAYVLARVQQAVLTLRKMPAVFCRQHASSWPDVVQNFFDAYGYHEPTPPKIVPTARQISEMDEVMHWLAGLASVDPTYSRIVWLRANGASYGRIGKQCGKGRTWVHTQFLNALYLLAERHVKKVVAKENSLS